MRKMLLLALAAALLAALIPAKAAARHTLAHRVSTLEAKVGCLVKYPVNEFDDYALYDVSSGVPSDLAVDTDDGLVVAEYGPFLYDNNSGFGIDFNYGYSFGPNAWLIGIKNTSTCRGRFATAPDPLSFTAAAASKVQSAKAARLR
jgi:opacity protein-like surface antigen